MASPFSLTEERNARNAGGARPGGGCTGGKADLPVSEEEEALEVEAPQPMMSAEEKEKKKEKKEASILVSLLFLGYNQKKR